MSHAIRTSTRRRATSGSAWRPRAAPASGCGSCSPATAGRSRTSSRTSGRLRRVGDLPFAGVLDTHATRVPAPMFATAAARPRRLRGGHGRAPSPAIGSPIADTDRVAFDVIDPARVDDHRDVHRASALRPRTIPGHGPLADAQGVDRRAREARHHRRPLAGARSGRPILGQVRFDVAMSVDDGHREARGREAVGRARRARDAPPRDHVGRAPRLAGGRLRRLRAHRPRRAGRPRRPLRPARHPRATPTR